MRAKLKVLRGSSTGRVLEITKKQFVIGRGEKCNLRPSHEAISRKHTAIFLHEDKVTVRDLKSRNGTLINGTAIKSDTELYTGDEIQLGPLHFKVTIVDDAGVVQERPAAASLPNANESDDDVTSWLEDKPHKEVSDPTVTRQFVMEETDVVNVDGVEAEDAESETKSFGFGKRKKKPKPGKLDTPAPKTSIGDNTQQAAAETLRRLFNRGS